MPIPTDGGSYQSKNAKKKAEVEDSRMTVTSELAKKSYEDTSTKPSTTKTTTSKKNGRNNSIGKLRIKLGQGEPYEKPSVITEVETPFAVKNRLLNLMGTNKVKLMNRAYNKLMYKRLTDQEDLGFEKRKDKRENIEHNRLNQLVISGDLEPDESMLSHPVVRVNATMRRLQAINQKYSEQGSAYAKTPPITPVEPFETDPNGRVFLSYNNHIKNKRLHSVEPFKENEAPEYQLECGREASIEEGDGEYLEKETNLGNDEVSLHVKFASTNGDLDIEPEITNSNEPPIPSEEQEIMDSVPVRSADSNKKNDENSLSSIVELPPPKQSQTSSIASLFDENAFLTESLQNIVSKFNEDVSINEKVQREFAILVRTANYRDSFVKQLEMTEMDQPKIFQLAQKIVKLYDRKQKVAEDKIKKVTTGGEFNATRTSV